MRIIGSILLLILSNILSPCLFAQVPTNQDCLNAIPICQNMYQTNISYSGEGNYPDEINATNSCLGSGEKNDVWYTFTVQQSGNLNFLITPNNMGDDYDWSVYNLTNKNCADIYNTPSMEVSCNFSATAGTTGPNGGSGLSSQGAGGTPYNTTVPVVVGETYVINVSNFSSTASGFTIDFGASSASIFDNVPPTLESIILAPACNGTSVTFEFSENILCNTVQPSDFTITGPDGNHTATSVSSTGCSNGATYDTKFTITFTPAISMGGNYCLNLVDDVTDLCGNVGIHPACLLLNVVSLNLDIQTNPTSCAGNDGTAIETIGSGLGYQYLWSTGETSSSISNLSIGVYSLTVSANSNSCSSVETFTIISSPNFPQLIINKTDIQCANSFGSANAIVNGGTNPYAYIWSNGSTDAIATGLTQGLYSLTVSDQNGCSVTGNTNIVLNIPNIGAIISTSVSCFGGANGSATAPGNGGNYTYLWSNNSNLANINGLVAGVYSVTLTDIVTSCQYQYSVSISQPSTPVSINLSNNVIICNGSNATLTASASGSNGGPYNYSWNPGNLTGSSVVVNPGLTTHYTVTATDILGCVSPPYEATVSVGANPVVSFSESATNGCAPLCIDFTNTTPNSANINWAFSDLSANQSGNTVNQCFTSTGIYSVSLTVTDLAGCSSTLAKSNYIQVYPNPIASFTSNPEQGSITEPSIQFINLSTFSDQWQWNFGDVSNSSSTNKNPSFEYLGAGSYLVTMTAINQFGCSSSTSQTIVIIDEYVGYIPNTFTPNNDNKNDIFNIESIGIQEKDFSLTMYNRWGSPIYSTKNLYKGWNGRTDFSQDVVENGVYIYFFSFTDILGKRHAITGHVTLLR